MHDIVTSKCASVWFLRFILNASLNSFTSQHPVACTVVRMVSFTGLDVEKLKLQEAFKHLDKDQDGVVTADEVVKALKSEGVKDSEKVKKRIAEKYKKGMTFTEFHDFIKRLVKSLNFG